MGDNIAWTQQLRANDAFGNRGGQHRGIFEEYNRRQDVAATYDAKLKAIGFLMRNLAFGHGLQDHNGRTRGAIMQHELRRLGLGCGTFMFNNNKDMAFNTPEYAVGKIQEGIDAYSDWQKTKVNPWSHQEHVDAHKQNFPMPPKVVACWNKNYKNKKLSKPTSIE